MRIQTPQVSSYGGTGRGWEVGDLQSWVRLRWLAHDEAPALYITIPQYQFDKTKQHILVRQEDGGGGTRGASDGVKVKSSGEDPRATGGLVCDHGFLTLGPINSIQFAFIIGNSSQNSGLRVCRLKSTWSAQIQMELSFRGFSRNRTGDLQITHMCVRCRALIH